MNLESIIETIPNILEDFYINSPTIIQMIMLSIPILMMIHYLTLLDKDLKNNPDNYPFRDKDRYPSKK